MPRSIVEMPWYTRTNIYNPVAIRGDLWRVWNVANVWQALYVQQREENLTEAAFCTTTCLFSSFHPRAVSFCLSLDLPGPWNISPTYETLYQRCSFFYKKELNADTNIHKKWGQVQTIFSAYRILVRFLCMWSPLYDLLGVWTMFPWRNQQNRVRYILSHFSRSSRQSVVWAILERISR